MIVLHSPFFCYGLSWKTKYYEPITLLLLRRVPNLTQNSAGQVTSKPLFRNLRAILMKRLRFLALPSSPPSCSRLAPCSRWACVCERVVGPDCPPEGSEFPPGLGLGLPPFLSVFLLSLSGWRLAPPPRPP